MCSSDLSEGRIDAGDAAARLRVAIETVRRDLDSLQRRGLLRRVHGGAISLDRMPHESTMPERRSSHTGAKRAIAAVAATHIPHEGAIFVDGGTTTELLAEHLVNRPALLVVTNNIPLANQVAESTTPVHLLSGRLRSTTLSSLGSRTVQDIANFRAQIVFRGANGLSAEWGFTTSDPEEAAVKQAMMRVAQESIVLADGSKFDSVFPSVFAASADIDRVVTDIEAPQAQVEQMVAAGVEVTLA